MTETTGILVFARMSSRRLPGKAMLDLAGRPLLARVLDRVRRARLGRPILATSRQPEDDVIAALGAGEGVPVFRGPLDDVAARAHEAARVHGLDVVVRISGDSPFIDATLIDRVVALRADDRADIATNVFPRGFPPGASVEAITVAALARVLEATDDPSDREHVTPFVYRHPDRFGIVNLAPDDPSRYVGVSLTVDTADDLERARWMAERLAPDAGLDAVVALARRSHVLFEEATCD